MAFVLLVASSAGAAPGWLAPVGLSLEAGTQAPSNGQEAYGAAPQVAFSKHGDAVAVWESPDGTDGKYGLPEYTLQTAFRPAGGAWQTPERIASAGESGELPSVAVDGAGNAVAVWEAYNGYTFVIEAASRPANGHWEEPTELDAAEVPGDSHPQIAVDEQGDAMAIWNRGGPFGGVVQEAFKPAGDEWQTPVEVAAGKYGDRPQVAFDEHRDAIALWQGFEGEPVNEWVLESASLPAGGAWQTPVVVSAPGVAGEPSLAINGQGAAAAAWDQWTNGFLSSRTVQAAVVPAEGAWQPAVGIVGAADEIDQPQEAENPAIAVDSQGDALAVWSWMFNDTVQAAFKPAGGTWQAPVDISTEGASSPQVAFDGRGEALAVWNGEDGTVQSSFKPAGGEWQAPLDIGHGGAPQIAVDGQGDALAAWTDEGGIQAAGYAAGGPQLNDLTIPAAGTAGQPVSLSVSPLDVWSIGGETSWSFGDGTSANGTSVTHTYATPGTYEVTVRSVDTLGNVTSTTSKITVARAAPPVPSSPDPTSPPPPEPPTISDAQQSSSTWRENGKAPIGTTFSMMLNERATLSFKFLHYVNAGTTNQSCTFITKRVCRRAPAGVLLFPARSGLNRIRFHGRIRSSKILKPGRYELIATATNPAGTSAPKAFSFRIVK